MEYFPYFPPRKHCFNTSMKGSDIFMAGKEIKVSKTYKTNNGVKLNAQWLKNATRSLGSNAGSVLQEISPNIYGVAESAAQIKRTFMRSKVSQNAVSQAIESNRYIKMGRTAIDNAIKDLKSGNFNNDSRSSGGNDESTSYSFGEINDAEAGSTGQIQVNLNPEGLTSINNSITKQTKFQMQAAKANVDAIVATSSAMMTMNQRNAEASLNMLTNINNSLQALIKYNNENMSKFIASSMTYYEMMGQVHAPAKKPGGVNNRLTGADVTDKRGNLNTANLAKLIKQNAKERYAETMPGQLTSMLDTFGEELVANPLKLVTTTLMKEIIPKSVKEATKNLDKTFGNFVTELLMKSSETLKASSGGKLSGLKQFLGSVLDINVKRQEKFNTAGKVTTDAAVFDGITRNAITTEIPKYLRESTAYLRQLVALNGGDPDKALAGSQIFNRESGTFQRYEDFTKELLGSINESVISSLASSDFGKTMSKVANSAVVGEQRQEAFEALLKKFYIALEKDDRQRIDLTRRGAGSDINAIIGSLQGDAALKQILEEAVYMSFGHGKGGINLNSARLNAKSMRNRRIQELEENNLGELSGLTKHGQTIDEAMASVIYGSDGHATRTTPYTPTSLLGRVTSIFDILERGINVRVTGKTPYGKFKAGAVNQNNNASVSSNQSSSNASSSSSGLMDEAELQAQLAGALDEPQSSNTSGRKGSKFFVNKTEHLGNMMHYILQGDPAKVYAEMGALFGEGVTALGHSMKDAVIAPLKETLFGDKDASITGKIHDMFSGLKEDMATFVLGPKGEDGKRTKTTSSVKGFLEEGLKSWSETLFGGEKSFEDIKKDLKDNIKKNSDAGLKGAVAGAGLGIASGGLLGTLVGGPLTGALLGTATAIFTKSEGFQKLMFGDQHEELEGKDGKKYDVRKGGLISPQIQKFFKEHKHDMIGSAGIGAIGGAFTGGGLLGTLVGGPVAGALLGTAVGIAKNSDTFKNLIFGKEVGEGDNKKRIGGILGAFNRAFEDANPKDKTKANAKSMAARGTVGAGAGLLMSMFTPLGPIGGAALGLATSMVSSKDRFHELLFGPKNKEGKTNEGLLTRLSARISKTVVAPLAGIASDALYDVKDAILDKVIDPIANLAEPIAGLTRRIYDRMEEKITGAFDTLKNAFGKVTGGIGKFFQKMVMKIFNRKRKDEKGDKSDKQGIFGKISDFARRSNAKASRKKWYDESYRTTQDFKDRYEKMNEKWNSLSDEQKSKYGDIDSFELEWAENIFYNGGDGRKDRLDARQARRAERLSSRQERRDKLNREALIAELTKGKYSNSSKEAMAEALEAYKKTRGYRRGKGMNGISHDDVQRLLTTGGEIGDAERTSEVITQQLDVEREQLDKLTDQLTLLERIEVGISDLVSRGSDGVKSMVSYVRQNHNSRRIERRSAQYEQSAFMADLTSDANMEVASDHRASGYNEYTGFKIPKETLKRLKSVANNPQNPMQSLAIDALDTTLNDSDRKKAYEKILKAWENKKNARKNNRMQHRQNVADAKNSRRNIRHLESESRDAHTNETLSRLREMTGGRGYADGTDNAKEGDAVVGENGPEIVRFGGGEKVLSNNDMIKVKIVDVDTSAAKKLNDTGTQDVNIVGQTGVLTTYGTSARLDHNTDNKSAIQKALSKKDTLVSYDQIKADNNDLAEEGEGGSTHTEKSSTWEKIKETVGGLGNILLGGGAIAALVKLLGNENVQEILKGIISAFGGSAETMASVAKNDGYEGGANAVTNVKNQFSRWGSILSDPKKFLLGEDGEWDSQSTAIARTGRVGLSRLLNGKSGKRKNGLVNALLHPVQTVKTAIRHPFKTLGNIGTGVKNFGKNALNAGKGLVNFIKSPTKLDDLKNLGKSLIKKTDASKQFTMIKDLATNFIHGEKGAKLSGAYNIVHDAVDGINPNKRGLSGWLTKTSDKLMNYAMEHGDAKTQSLVAKLTGHSVDEMAPALANKAMKEAGEEATEKAAKTATKKAGKKGFLASAKEFVQKVSKFGAGKVANEGAENLAENALEKTAKTAIKEVGQKVVKETAEDAASKSIIAAAKKGILEAIEKVASTIMEKGGKKLAGKLSTTGVKKVITEVFEKISKGLVGKMGKWIAKKLAAVAARLGISLGVTATGVGAIATVVANGAFLVLGAINSAGKGGTARMFRCKQADVDWKMQIISAAIGGLVETDIGCVVDVANEIYCALTGDDFITRIATAFYNAISGKEDEEALKASQTQLINDWEAYKENFLQTEWKTFCEENPDLAMDFETYKQKVANGELESDVMGLAEYNDDQNKTVGAKIADGAKDAWNWTKDTAKKGWDATVSGAKKAGNWIADTASSGWNAVKSGWNSLWGGKGGKGGSGAAVPFYSQKDPRWAGMQYTRGGSGESMSEIGCGPTAFAMAASGATGRNIDPVQAAGAMQRVGARDNTGTNWGGIGAAADMYGIETRMQQNPSGAFIDSELNAGNPVVLSGRSGGYGTPYTPQGHYVVATGKDNDGNYIVNDPNRLGGSRKFKKADMLAETGAAWGFGGKGHNGMPSDVEQRLYGNTTSGSVTSMTSGYNGMPSDVQAKQVAQNNAKNEEKKQEARAKWLNIVRAVKKALADLHVGYSQSRWVTVTLGGKPLSVRTDCSGYVTACLKFFGVIDDKANLVSNNYANPNTQALLKAGFSSHPFTSWDLLEEGDIIGVNGHVEIFAYNKDGKHYVYNCGSDKSCNSPIPTVTGHKTYTTYWTPGEPGSGIADASSVSSSADGSTTGDATTSSSSGMDFFSKITSFFSELGSRAVSGFTTGKWNKDWSGVFGDSSFSTAYSGSTISSTGEVVADTSVKGSTSAERIWNLLKQQGMTNAGIAGVLGNLHAESGLRTNNVQNSYESKVGSDTEYTAKVDNGSYNNFAHDSAGYGLAQWTYHSRKQALLDLARSRGKSIADESVQTSHLLNELSKYPDLVNTLKTTSSVSDATSKFMLDYERPADQSQSAQNKRAGYAQAYYDQYAHKSATTSGSVTSMTTGYNGMPSDVQAKMYGSGGAGAGGRGVSSTGIIKPHMTSAPVSGKNMPTNSSDVSSVIHYLSQILAVLDQSSDKLDALNYLKSLANSGGNVVTNNNIYSQTNNNGVRAGQQQMTASKTDPNKFSTAQKIASGGL